MTDLEGRTLSELHELAAAQGVPRFRALRREDLIEAIGGDEPGGGEEEAPIEPDERDEERDEPEPEQAAPAETCTGVLDLVPDGFGFVRVEGFKRSGDDVFVARSQIRALGLRAGDEISGSVRRKRRNERHSSLAEVSSVNGGTPAERTDRPSFADLTPVHPRERLPLADAQADLTGRMVDLVAPLARGSRVLVSGPPRGGATTLLRKLLEAATRDGSLVPVVLLVDARPEEVTDWQRAASYPVHGTAADASADESIGLATMALERARRLVEEGKDVLLAIDSISRLARAHALARSRAQGEDHATPVQVAKRWFAAGRNVEQGGSLTIFATAHTGAGTTLEAMLHETLTDIATAELVLDGELALAGLEPAIDVRRSFARLEGPLASEAEQSRRLRASLDPLPAAGAWNHLADRIRDTASNEQLLAAVLGAI